MRSVTRVGGLVASVAMMLGSGLAQAQVYPPPIANPPPAPPSHASAPPPEPAPAAYYRHHHHHYYRHYYYARRYAYAGCHQRNGRIGAVAGAVGGGIIGAAITHGNPAFTAIGAGAGALTGHALARNSAC